MKSCSRWVASLSLLIAVFVDAEIAFAESDFQARCSFKSYSVAELTPEYEASLGISDEYKTPQLRSRHLAEIKHRQTGSSNPDFLSFKSRQVDGLLSVFSNGSSNRMKQVPKTGDVEFVFWESKNPYFNNYFWFPKYVESFFVAPDQTERFLDSPWIKIRLNSTTCKATVLTLWNVRQFIADEAFLSGSAAAKDGVVTPQKDTEKDWPKEFLHEVIGERYYSSEVGNIRDRISLLNKIKSGQPARANAAKATLPSELFWFYTSIDADVRSADTGSFGYLLAEKQDAITRGRQSELLSTSRLLVEAFLASKAQVDRIRNVVSLQKILRVGD